jgi:hypothetical protein
MGTIFVNMLEGIANPIPDHFFGLSEWKFA